MPDEQELKKLRDYRTKRRKMFNRTREMVTYIVFLFLLMTVCYGNRSKYGFLTTQDIKNTFSEFNKVMLVLLMHRTLRIPLVTYNKVIL